eukprot:TRINITY_DN3239_c2_g4_i1.p1 TRINITY_DN3239_c2_g4~~TRINITY_DN3239_c2_g4_i1.p1  ORF type:complete len:389 (+),score=92.52 TRINITY_DN3239_c2_g4_i1:70-1236(+)
MAPAKGKAKPAVEERRRSSRRASSIGDVWQKRYKEVMAERDVQRDAIVQLEASIVGHQMKYDQMCVGLKTALDLIKTIEDEVKAAREVNKNIQNARIDEVLRPFDTPRTLLQSLLPPYDGPEYAYTFPQRFNQMKAQLAGLQEDLTQARLQIRKLEALPSFETSLNAIVATVTTYIPTVDHHKLSGLEKLKANIVALKPVTEGKPGGPEAKQHWYDILGGMANVPGEPITISTQTSQQDTIRANLPRRQHVFCSHCGAGPYADLDGATERCSDCGEFLDKTQTELSLWRQSTSHWLRRAIDLRQRTPAEITTVSALMKGSGKRPRSQPHNLSLSQCLLQSPKRGGAARLRAKNPLDLVGGVQCGWVPTPQTPPKSPGLSFSAMNQLTI